MVERIKELCKKNSTTMGTLERELGFGNGTIRRWSERIPSADKALILANRLGVTVEYLLTGKEAAELTPAEQKLLDAYRESSSTGQELIFDYTQTIKKKFPAEQESSSSKIG